MGDFEEHHGKGLAQKKIEDLEEGKKDTTGSVEEKSPSEKVEEKEAITEISENQELEPGDDKRKKKVNEGEGQKTSDEDFKETRFSENDKKFVEGTVEKPEQDLEPKNNEENKKSFNEEHKQELQERGFKEPEKDAEKIEESKQPDGPKPDLKPDSKIDQYKSLLSQVPEEDQPSFLESNPEIDLALNFNYEFNSKEKLVNLNTGEGFKFTNQSDYVRLGKVVQRYIEKTMTAKYKLIKLKIPVEDPENPTKSYIFISPNFQNPETQHSKALLLIQGAGAVRPGIWARSVCINDSLRTGSMNSFLAFAERNKFEVIIFNPNKNRSKGKPVPENSSLESHGKYIWQRFIRHNAPRDLYIIGHSCGGISTISLMNLFWDEFKERVKGIAFTDAVHSYHGLNPEKISFCRRRAVDWVASRKPLDAREGRADPIVFVSSGHERHEYTTGSARKSIKKYLLEINEKNPYLE